ncbi:MAG: cache domain-containing protein [Elainella sp.]
MPQFLKSLRRSTQPGLKVSLVGAMIATIGATAAIVYIPWAMTSRRNVNALMSQVNQEIVGATRQEVERLFLSAQSAQQLTQSSFKQQIVALDDLKQQEAFFLSALAANPDFTWIQLGFANGDFIGAQRTPDGLLRFHIRDWDPQTRKTSSQIHSYRTVGSELKLVERDRSEMTPAFYAPQRPWYQNAMKTPGETAWTVYVYRSTNAPGMDATMQLRQGQQTVGVIGVGIELTQLSSYLQRLKGEQAGEAFIINSQNELIASTDPKEVEPAQIQQSSQLRLRSFEQAQNPQLQFASRMIQDQKIGLNQLKTWQQYSYTDPDTGEQYLISLAPVGYLDWMVGTVIPKSSYLTEINQNKQILLVVISLFVLTTAGLAVLSVERLIARPILRVAHAAADIEAEQFQLDSLTPVAERTDELGQLARVFQKMAQQIYVREQQLKKQVQELKIEIDEAKRQKQVSEIVETDFFQDLMGKAQTLRKRNQSRLGEEMGEKGRD